MISTLFRWWNAPEDAPWERLAIASDSGDMSGHAGAIDRLPAGDAYRLAQVGRVYGRPEADVTIVVFTSFQCHYCADFHVTLDRLAQRYPDHLNIRYRHYVPSMNRHALRIHLASECAGDQGAFWDYATWAFGMPAVVRHRNGWRVVADSAGVADLGEFFGCTDTRAYAANVREDNEQAKKLGIVGTPTSYVNGVRVIGAASFETMDSLVAFLLDRI